MLHGARPCSVAPRLNAHRKRLQKGNITHLSKLAARLVKGMKDEEGSHQSDAAGRLASYMVAQVTAPRHCRCRSVLSCVSAGGYVRPRAVARQRYGWLADAAAIHSCCVRSGMCCRIRERVHETRPGSCLCSILQERRRKKTAFSVMCA